MPELRGVLAIFAAFTAILILQLVPLPPSVWTMLPNREAVAEGFALAGTALPWLPMSLDPDASLAVLASLLVPAAGLALFAATSARGLRWALIAVVVAALASILLGAAQQMAGEGTALQPYANTNPGKATGLFANRNHLATLVALAIPCALLLLPGRFNGPRVIALVAFLLAGAVLAGSKAGIGLALVSTAVGAVWIHARRRARGVWIALLAAGGAVIAAGALWLMSVAGTPPPGGAEQHRPAMIATTLDAARDYFPAGSGAGTFLRVYQHYEDPAAASPQYRNHAHSDYAEILLEYGAPGALLILAAIGWWAVQVHSAWRGGPEMAAARCGVIMLGVVLAHSLVDYPLRTGALAVLAALAAVLATRRNGAPHDARPDRSDPLEDEPGHLRIAL
jgi:O-antigen ligase